MESWHFWPLLKFPCVLLSWFLHLCALPLLHSPCPYSVFFFRSPASSEPAPSHPISVCHMLPSPSCLLVLHSPGDLIHTYGFEHPALVSDPHVMSLTLKSRLNIFIHPLIHQSSIYSDLVMHDVAKIKNTKRTWLCLRKSKFREETYGKQQ